MSRIINKFGSLHTSEYRILHYWVEKHLGKPNKCENCGVTETKRFTWANISGEYKKELSDWKRLCSSCHRQMDIEDNYKCGHPKTMEYSYYWPNGFRTCRMCKNANHKLYKQLKRKQ